jgi:hypothetical protein
VKAYIFFDHDGQPQYYGAVQSADLDHWQDVSQRVSFPKGARPGAVLNVPAAVVHQNQTLTTHTTNQP